MPASTGKTISAPSGRQALILLAALLLFLALCVIAAIGANRLAAKRQTQKAAEAAALAAARVLEPALIALAACAPGDDACRVEIQSDGAFYGPVARTVADVVAKNWRGGPPPTLTRCSSEADTNCWSWPYEDGRYGVDPRFTDAAFRYVEVTLERPSGLVFAE